MKSWFELSEDVLIFKTNTTAGHAELIRNRLADVIDSVVTDNELAVQHSTSKVDSLAEQIILLLDLQPEIVPIKEFIVPVCYDFGMDWEEVENQTGLGRAEIERLHQSTSYDVSTGFTPGFLYLSGLPRQIHCKRRAIPRTQIPKGSVGIGGEKTGIYSLATPGGWQIIGRTPLVLFDPEAKIPLPIPQGSKVRFQAISQEEFDKYGSA